MFLRSASNVSSTSSAGQPDQFFWTPARRIWIDKVRSTLKPSGASRQKVTVYPILARDNGTWV
jgi:LPS sulfotransferase NodH